MIEKKGFSPRSTLIDINNKFVNKYTIRLEPIRVFNLSAIVVIIRFFLVDGGYYDAKMSPEDALHLAEDLQEIARRALDA